MCWLCKCLRLKKISRSESLTLHRYDSWLESVAIAVAVNLVQLELLPTLRNYIPNWQYLLGDPKGQPNGPQFAEM